MLHVSNGAFRNLSRFACCAFLQVIDLTHFPDRLVPHGGAAGHARHPHYMPADLHARRREHLARANWRPPMVPNGAAPGPDLLQRSPGVGVLRQRVQVVPAVHFPAPGARAAQETPPHSSKKKSGTTASPTPPQEESGPTCAICLDSLKDSLCCAPCGHVFHYKCLKEAIVKFKYCPTCRKPIKTEKTIKKIFL